MLELNGKYNTAKVFTDNIDSVTISQIIELCNQEFSEGSTIRIMPDCHAGAGCVIGTTMTISDKIVPNLVGVDIGCGMVVANIGNVSNINLEKLDQFIRNNIPSGHDVYSSERNYYLDDLKCVDHINKNRALCSIGTLGGGNHFIEVNKDKNNNILIVVHSGSRYLGKQIADYYQNKAYTSLNAHQSELDKLIQQLKEDGRQSEISNLIRSFKSSKPNVSKDLAYVTGELMLDYLNDMTIAQEYAYTNRKEMVVSILKFLGISGYTAFQTIHNFIDVKTMMLRKGAISAEENNIVIIPMNMRDGSLICKGKGNPDWNNLTPHGAGRIMSRSQAKQKVTLEEYEQSMNGIYTTSVSKSTLDESPMTYKPMQEIIDNIGDTVDILDIIKPIYNFKASE